MTLLARVMAPVLKDLYAGAKGQVAQALNRLTTTAGAKKLVSTLVKMEKVKTIWSAEDEVSLKKFYYPSKLSIDDEAQIIDSVDVLPEGNLVIEGIVGQGKSIFMRHLACSLLQGTEVTQIPFLLELRNISARRTLYESIYNFLKNVGISGGEETFSYLAGSGKIVLILDGFDEIPTECVSDTIIEIDALQNLYSELKIIVSSRPQSDIQNLVGFKILSLVPLTPTDYDPFVKKLIPQTAKRVDVVDALNACPDNIRGIISTPLMLTLVIVVYQTEKEIPLSLSEFFDKLFGVVFTKHDKLKAGFNRQHHSGLAERRLRQLFDAFCFMVVQFGGGRSLKRQQFNKAFDAALRLAKSCQCEVEDFRKDIIKVACLLIEEGLDLTTFLHKSILDYHAAAFVKELHDKQANSFYLAAMKDYRKWQHVLAFLKVIDEARYARDYYLEATASLYQDLVAALDSPDDKEFTTYLLSFAPQAEAGIHEDSLLSWGTARTQNNELGEEISGTILHCVIDVINDARAHRLKEMLDSPTTRYDATTSTAYIPFKTILEILGVDEFRLNLRGVEHAAYINIEKYKNVVANESDQEVMLEDLLSSPVEDVPNRRRKAPKRKP